MEKDGRGTVLYQSLRLLIVDGADASCWYQSCFAEVRSGSPQHIEMSSEAPAPFQAKPRVSPALLEQLGRPEPAHPATTF